MVQEQLHRVEIGAALQQTASGLAPQVVHVEVHLRKLLAAAGKESTVRSPMWTVTDRARPKRRPRLLVVLQAFADFVAEDVRFRLEFLAIRIMPAKFKHRPQLLRQWDVPRPQALRRPIRQVQLVEIPSQLPERHVEDFADATTGLQGGDEA